MFQTEGDHKGLFTFYRQQAELQQKFAAEQKLSQSKSQSSKTKNHLKSKHVPQRLDDIDEQQDRNFQSSVNLSQKLSPKKSFQLLNKAYIKQLSLKNQSSPEPKSKELASQIVVILKGRGPSKQDLKLNRLNLKYQMQQGHFLKEKIFTPLQQVTTTPEQIQQSNKNLEQSLKLKKTMKKNQRMSNRYGHSKSQLQNELILSREMKPTRQNIESVRFQGVKKVNMFNELQQLPQIERGYTTSHQSSNHIAHKRIPPKTLASILKSENNQIIRQLRKAIEREKEEDRKSAMIQRHHSFIEYGSFDYDRKQLDLGKLNEKQRRMISILNKFSKRD